MAVLRTLLLFAALVLLGPQVQAASGVLGEYTAPLRHAIATWLMDFQLQAAVQAATETTADQADDDDDDDDDDIDPAAFLPWFAGSLAHRDAELLQTLEGHLQQVLELLDAPAGKQEELAQALERVQDDLGRVRALLAPMSATHDPLFQAALLAQLVHSDYGVDETYEDAAEGEKGAYFLAWMLLQHSERLWAELKGHMPEVAEDVERGLARLDELMPSSRAPDSFQDPEDAEAAALDIAFALERGAGQPLLMRDFNVALDLVARQVGSACTALQAGDERLALEEAGAARVSYKASLAATLSTLAPEAHEAFNAARERFSTLGAGDPAAASTCADWQAAVERARETFG